MKTNTLKTLSIIALMMVTLSSCELVEGIFKAGVWVGILFVVGIIALVIFLITRLGGRK